MAELSITQITQQLNELFKNAARERTLVFWYDAAADFQDEVASLELRNNVHVWQVEEYQQFKTKYHLEKEDPEGSYLIYAPFAKPSLRENHLADMLYYSKEFHADRVSLLALKLGITGKQRETLQDYLKFFGNKERTSRFTQLKGVWTAPNAIVIGIMSVLCKVKAANFEEVLRAVLTGDSQSFLEDFGKYQVLDDFWRLLDEQFGIAGSGMSVDGVIQSLFVTSLSRMVAQPLPAVWQSSISAKSGSVLVFLERLMNHVQDGEWFDKISSEVYTQLGGNPVFDTIPLERLLSVPLFEALDQRVIHWMVGRLLQGDYDAQLDRNSILDVIAIRESGHFGARYRDAYEVIRAAYQLLRRELSVTEGTTLSELTQRYQQEWYQSDRDYRHFYRHYDALEDAEPFEELREAVEQHYDYHFLQPLARVWGPAFEAANMVTGLPLQRNFYKDQIADAKERIVVIISDAMRYEVAHELFERLQLEEKCEPHLDAMQGVVPAITDVGMPALLPHTTIEMDGEYEALVDGKKRKTVETRELQLKQYNPKSRAVKYETIIDMKTSELREIFTGQEVVYVYHNQIDAVGDNPKTENEVFRACEDAIKEVRLLMLRIASRANTTHFIITSDHGFIYQRDKQEAYDKIALSEKDAKGSYRYVLTDKPQHHTPGVRSTMIGEIFDNDDDRYVSYPLGYDNFERRGAGNRYRHGAPTAQEMIIPLLKVRVEKSRRETHPAPVVLVRVPNRITTMTTTLEFLQREPVTDIVKEATYQMSFVDAEGIPVSNEAVILANSTELDSSKRLSRLTFLFKNQRYHRSESYYFVATNLQSNEEAFRYEVSLDIPYRDDQGYLE